MYMYMYTSAMALTAAGSLITSEWCVMCGVVPESITHSACYGDCGVLMWLRSAGAVLRQMLQYGGAKDSQLLLHECAQQPLDPHPFLRSLFSPEH